MVNCKHCYECKNIKIITVNKYDRQLMCLVSERLVKLVDYYEGSFQDFIGHCDTIDVLRFSQDSKLLFSVSHSEIFVWEVTV